MHIMIDLETMGTAADAPILAIGAARFTATGGVAGSMYWLIDGATDIALGAKPDWATILWWMQQSDEARLELVKPEATRLHIIGALHELSRYIRETPDLEGVWGNGASFDNALLAAAYRRAKVDFPYSFRLDRCYRTLRALHPNIEIPPTEDAHNALADSIWQAIVAARILAAHTP